MRGVASSDEMLFTMCSTDKSRLINIGGVGCGKTLELRSSGAMPHILNRRKRGATDGMLNGNNQQRIPTSLDLAQIEGLFASHFDQTAHIQFDIRSVCGETDLK